jgi:hypothetical protein
MPAPPASPLVAVDANVVMDLGEGAESVLDALDTIRQRLRSPRIARLTIELQSFDLSAPVIASPREVVRKFFQR